MIHFRLDHARRVRIATYQGRVNDDELMGAYRAQLALSDYDPSFDDLADLSGVEELDVSASALRDLTSLFSGVDALGNPTRLAIIAPGDLGYGLGRMYEMMRDGAPEEVQVFREMDEALAWLADRT